MREMGFMEKLLDGVGVEWKTVDEIFNLKNGYTPFKNNNDFWEDGDIPWFRMEDIRCHGRILSDAIQKITQSAIKGKIFPANSLVMSTTATLGEHALVTVPHLTNQQITNFSIKENLKDSLNIKYLYHCFFAFGKWCQENANKSGGMGIIGIKKLKQYEIPIPYPDNPKKSLEIQDEIVRILDAMTAHTAELTAELTARKKQYDYYRDKLLSFEEGAVEWLDLDTLTKIKTGQSVNKQMISDNPGEYAVINSGREPLGFIDLWNTDNDPIGITSRGAGVGSITWREGKYFRGNLNYSVTIKNKDKISIRYLYHILQKMQLEIQALCTFDGIPALNASNLKTLEIPVPSLDEQNRIVAILDKFDALTASITEGLPCEIELREKQYAYYRDLLLSFPAAQAV